MNSKGLVAEFGCFYSFYSRWRIQGHGLELIQSNIQMQEQSSNLSDHSNFFSLSSDSSRHNHHNHHKHQYSSFVKKVKRLLQIQNDDLDELYRKVEIIVRKYFQQHKIVQFSDMYSHLACLKTNSTKMTAIVALLQRNIIAQAPTQYTAETISKNKQRLEIRLQRQERQIREDEASNKGRQQRIGQQKLKQFKESFSSVLNSLQNDNQLTRLQKSDAITTNTSEQPKSHKTPKKKEQSPSNYSPDRLNSSFQEYQARNRQYEQKVKELLSELHDIKESMTNNNNQTNTNYQQSNTNQSRKSRQQQQRNSRQQHQRNSRYSEPSLQYEQGQQTYQPKLQYAKEERREAASEASIIDSCLQKNLMNETNQTNLSEPKQPTHTHPQLQLNHKLQSIKEKSNQSITSSKTITNPNKLDHLQINKQVSISEKTNSLSVQQKKLVLLQQAESITKQLHQLKEFASLLQIQSNQHNPTTTKPEILSSHLSHPTQNNFPNMDRNNSNHQITQNSRNQIPQRNENQIPQINNKNQILQRIVPTVSKSMIQSLNPSFKELKDNQPSQFQQLTHLPSLKMVDSFSFSQKHTHPVLQTRPLTRTNHIVLKNHHYSGNSNLHSAETPSFSQNPQPQQIQTIKYIYHPYSNPPQNSNAAQPTHNISQTYVKAPHYPNASVYNTPIGFSHEANNRPMAQSFKNSSESYLNNQSYNSQTSIMRGPHFQPIKNTPKRITFDNSKYSHLRQPSHSHSNIQQSQVRLITNQSLMLSKIPQTNSSSMLRKKGINMLSPQPRPFLHQ